MRKYFFLVLIAGMIVFPFFSFAQNTDKITLILFHGEECPHCQVERVFLKDLQKEFTNLEIKEYEVWHNDTNKKLFKETEKKLGIDKTNMAGAVPLTVVGDKYLVGFDTPQNYGEKIKDLIKGEEINTGGNNEIKIPFFGRVDAKSFSLPVLAAVVGTLDGFNPCSMWSLIVMLTLVIATGSRRKVWLIGWTFIITSSVSYFLFMSAWLNVFIFMGYLMIIRIIVGVVALASGIISIREYYTFKPNVCEVGSTEEQKNKITKKIEKVVASPSILWLILGVVGIAFSVNLIEMMCSLGLPVVFTKTLSMFNLPQWEYYAYILLYVFFYMILNILVVLVAGFTMKFMQITDRYSRWFRLIAGILMLILGLIFFIKPELLMFG
jgi:thiol-disulfide isomerase/thioredoxin